jgi:hypothetical protein
MTTNKEAAVFGGSVSRKIIKDNNRDENKK